MKKIKNKLFLCLALSALIIPMTNAFAEEPSDNPTQSPAPTDPTPSATPTPPPTEEPTKNPELLTLDVEGVNLSPSFSKNQENYTAVVASNVESINIKATADKDMTVRGVGTQTLKEGANTFEITVNAGTSGSKVYKITVTRATSNLNLKSLRIQGQSLNEAFEPTVLNYTADIPYNMDSIIVQAGASNSGATFQVLGNTNLKVGKNTVRIIVKNKADEKQEYRIIVTRAAEEDNEKDEDDDDNSVETSMDLATSTSQGVISKDERPDKGSTLKYILVVVFCLILLVVSGIGIYFYIRTGDNEKRKQKKLEKLKKKQEKLNQKLTGAEEKEEQNEALEEETKEEVENSEVNEVEETIDLNENFDEETKEIEVIGEEKKRSDKNVLEDFDDLFLDE